MRTAGVPGRTRLWWVNGTLYGHLEYQAMTVGHVSAVSILAHELAHVQEIAALAEADDVASRGTGDRRAGCDAVVQRALALVPRKPAAVRVLAEDDPILTVLGHSLEHVEGFVRNGDPSVYSVGGAEHALDARNISQHREGDLSAVETAFATAVGRRVRHELSHREQRGGSALEELAVLHNVPLAPAAESTSDGRPDAARPVASRR
jgi:hypothetical protein